MPHLESPYTTTTEPAYSGAHGPQLERSPQASTKNQWLLHAAMTIPCATTKTWCSFKKKAKIKTNKPPKSFLKTHQRVQAFWAQATLFPCVTLAINFSLLQTLTFRFVWPPCTLDMQVSVWQLMCSFYWMYQYLINWVFRGLNFLVTLQSPHIKEYYSIPTRGRYSKSKAQISENHSFSSYVSL